MSRYELTYGVTTAEDSEVLGNWLLHAAEERATSFEEDASDGQRRLVADLFHIAADAFDSAAALSAGEIRAEHYSNRAHWIRKRAKIIVATSDCSV
jgi:coenzyme F420-reducing hydrogenase gamma subunit